MPNAAPKSSLFPALLLLLLTAPALAGPGGGEPDLLGGSEHEEAVSARLLSDHAVLAPGTSFTLGVEISMDPGWHTYWENGGDAGLPTSVEWTLPEGFTASDIRWPTPHRYEEAGDVVTFGYGTRTMLLVDLTAPEELSGDRAEIGARVDWLQCKDICIPGGAEVSVRLPVAAEAQPADDAVLARFEESRGQLPTAAGSLPNVALHPFQSLDAVPAGETAEVAVVLVGLDRATVDGAEYYPRPSDQLWLRDARFRQDGNALAVIMQAEVDAAVEPGSVVMLPAVVRLPRTGEAEDLLLTFEVPVTVADAGAAVVPTNAPVFAAAGPLLPKDDAAAAANGPGLLRYFVLAFLGGIILNVMPCVLPVISLKILGFVSQADEHPGKIARLGLTFAGGVIVSFLVLAGAVIALQAAGEHIGWGFQFQNPGFVAALAIVVFVFSLSLLGVFEIGGLASLAGMGAAAAQRKEYADAFFHGILTTVLATPCTAPMLGAAVAFALSQPPFIIIAIFTTVAIGLALPYVLLSLNPGWLKYVPRPGVWMDTFKQAMGFLMLATLVWLLFVFGAQTGADGLTWLLGFLLLLGFFSWLHGRFLDLTSTTRRVVTIWILTLVGVGIGYRQMLHDHIFAEVPVGKGDAMALSESVEVTEGGVRWEPFSVETLETAVSGGRTVFIDFTADWCWTCKVNEKTVLADSDVEEAFLRNEVLTLKGDWTRKDPEITEILQRHERAGVPFYAVYPAGNLSDVIVLPEIINKKLVLESLEAAGPSRSGV